MWLGRGPGGSKPTAEVLTAQPHTHTQPASQPAAKGGGRECSLEDTHLLSLWTNNIMLTLLLDYASVCVMKMVRLRLIQSCGTQGSKPSRSLSSLLLVSPVCV